MPTPVKAPLFNEDHVSTLHAYLAGHETANSGRDRISRLVLNGYLRSKILCFFFVHGTSVATGQARNVSSTADHEHPALDPSKAIWHGEGIWAGQCIKPECGP